MFCYTPAVPSVNNTHTIYQQYEKPSASTSVWTSAGQTNYVPVFQLSAQVSSTPSIEIDYAGSSSDESDVEEENAIPKRRLMSIVKQLYLNLLDPYDGFP